MWMSENVMIWVNEWMMSGNMSLRVSADKSVLMMMWVSERVKI